MSDQSHPIEARLMLALSGHTKAIRCVRYSPIGELVASGSEDATVRFWSLPSGKLFHVWDDLSSGVESLAFAPDGHFLVAGLANGELRVSDLETRREVRRIEAHDSGVRSLVFASDGAAVFSAGSGSSVKRWQLPVEDFQASNVQIQARSPARSLALKRDARLMAVGCLDGSIKLRQAQKGRLVGTMADTSSVYALAFSPNDKILASGNVHGYVSLWDVESQQLLVQLEGQTWPIYDLAFSRDGRTLLSASADGEVRLWDTQLGREQTVYHWNSGWVTTVAIAPDGMTAAVGGADQTLVVWDLDAFG